jgi:hypothetical protein
LPLRLRELKHWPTSPSIWPGRRKQYIDHVLHACQGDKAAAATLGIDISRLG